MPGWLLYRFGINEILTTVLLNFVSFNLVNFVCTGPWRDTTAGHPMTIAIGKGGFLPMILVNPPLNMGIVLAIVVTAAVYFYTTRSVAGYELIATGANPRAAKVFGIHTRKMFIASLVIAGAVGGLSGAIEVAGIQHRLIEGLQHNFLILGLIIGLIAKGNNLAVPFVAFFISVLEIGASAMQRTLMIPVEMVFIVEALILLFVLLSDVVRRK
jgi:simple sugar transport system permease protein